MGGGPKNAGGAPRWRCRGKLRKVQKSQKVKEGGKVKDLKKQKRGGYN